MVRAKRCCVHAYFRINGVSKRWFKTPKNVRLRSWLEQNADSGGSMNAKSHITTFKWRHINAFPVHLSSNNSLEQCAVQCMLTKSSSSRGKHEQYSREGRFGSAFWISVSKRWFCVRKISMNAASVSRVRFTRNALSLRRCIAQFHPIHNAFKGVSKQLCVYHLYRSVFLAQTRIRSPFFPRLRKAFLTPLSK